MKPPVIGYSRRASTLAWIAIACAMLVSTNATAATLSEAEELFKAGKYRECIAETSTMLEEDRATESWRLLRIKAQLEIGEYSEASESLKAALEEYPYSIQLRWLGREVHRFSGNAKAADEIQAEIAELARTSSWRYRDSANALTLGKFFLANGADAKEVLTGVYDTIKSRLPTYTEVHLASGELALAKHDYGLAAASFQEATRLDPLEPAAQFGLARSFGPSDSERATAALQAALELNPKHVPSLLELVDSHIDAERYDLAAEIIAKVLDVNPKQSSALAYRVILAHLNNDTEAEKQAREAALATWSSNPEVDFLIGKKLSQKYRFAEGSAYQRRALKFDPKYLPAKMQLSQDLLRLGHEDEGWAMAAEVFESDNYNVMAHNLATLHDRLDKFTIIRGEGFLVRMDEREAAIYGDRVLTLLARARDTLREKYDVELDEPTYVDIYNRQQDFAIRTFGMPGGAGFLGVCFGRVVTMNSPASQGATPSNWEAVLWHEFCHVVTLTKSNNKMPRWLSEGISVYEERQENASWGQSMNLQYREMILGGQLTPVSKLSAAFLSPQSPLHLQFAYFESAMVVEYLVDNHGHETLLRVLTDLGVGMPINESLQRYVGSLETLDKEFEAYAREQAEALAPDADFAEAELERSASAEEIAKWLEEHPNSIDGLRRQAQSLLEQEAWEQAKAPLEKLLELHPTHIGGDNALLTLAKVHEELEETEKQREYLARAAELSNDAVDVYLKLCDLANEVEDWEAVRAHAEQALAVNPLIKAPHRLLAEAAENLDDPPTVIAGLSALAHMEPFDPAGLHYRLATMLHRLERTDEAKRHVLLALEEAPRYREALALLLEIAKEPSDDE